MRKLNAMLKITMHPAEFEDAAAL